MIARVLPLTQTRAIKGLFDYILPPELVDEVTVGSLLRVRFAGRSVPAVVAELAATSELPPERLETATDVLPARLPADLVTLAQWIAAEYCSTPARALAVMLPPGATRGLTEKRVLTAALTPAGQEALTDGTRLTEGQNMVLTALAASGPVPAVQLGTATLRRLQGRGLVTIDSAVSSRRPDRHAVSSISASAPPLTGEQKAALVPIIDAFADLANASMIAPDAAIAPDSPPMGTFLLLACDVRLAARGPHRMGLNEVAIGIAPPSFAIELARSRLHPAWLSRTVTLGEMYEPDDALTAGFLDRVVAPEKVGPALDEIITAFRAIHRPSHATAKQRLRQPAMDAMRAAIDRELTMAAYEASNRARNAVAMPA